MEITREFLREKGACADGFKWFCECGETEHEAVINKLISENRPQWANWVIVRLMTKEQCVKYAIFAAEQVIGIFEAKYPDDDRPRKAIEAARKYLENPSKENREAAAAAAADAYAYAVYTYDTNAAYAYAAAYAADYAASAAAAAYAAVYTYDTYAAAANAAYAAGDAYAAAKMKEIIMNGLEILR
jgi:hypothetical protein